MVDHKTPIFYNIEYENTINLQESQMELLTCPVCVGTRREPAGDNKYKSVIAGYDLNTDTFACTNCGAQRMYGQATGLVRPNQQGNPCHHSYRARTVGRCLTEYTCEHCGDRYQIDSGD